MVKKIEYIQCDCGGKLNPIAHTETGGSLTQGYTRSRTVFFGCDSCINIYRQEEGHITGTPGSEFSRDIAAKKNCSRTCITLCQRTA
ncbi:MAG: hypothetical protein JSV92_00545, partial [archaeon]